MRREISETFQASQRSLIDLRSEHQQLSSQNDRLSGIIAQNLANKKVVKKLQAQLDAAQGQGSAAAAGRKVFSLVDENIEVSLKETSQVLTSLEATKSEKLKTAENLADKKLTKLAEIKQLELEIKRLEKTFQEKTEMATKVATKRIETEEEIQTLQETIMFEKNHHSIVARAVLRGAAEEGSSPSDQANSSSASEPFSETLKKVLEQHASAFGVELEELYRQANAVNTGNFSTAAKTLDQRNAVLKSELLRLTSKLHRKQKKFEHNESQKFVLQKQLDILDNQKNLETSVFDKRKQKSELRVEQLTVENKDLKNIIAKTKTLADQAVQEIVKIQFEIKAYERMMVGAEGSGSEASSSRRSSVASTMSSRVSQV